MKPPVRIVPVDCDRERYRDLLLLADEQWDMVGAYLYRGEMFVAFAWDEVDLAPDHALGCMVLTDEGVDDGERRIAELKNLAVHPAHQRSGLGRALVEHASSRLALEFDVLRVGTGDSPLTVPFYESCGFSRSYVLPNFFVDNYDHPIIEAGVRLKDMVVFERSL